MDQKSSASSFSMAELRDLFTLDENTECQTHDLLDCDCRGRGGGGLNNVSRSEVVSSGETEDGSQLSSTLRNHGQGNDTEDDGSDTDSLPDLLPGLMKASQVDMAKVEEVSDLSPSMFSLT